MGITEQKLKVGDVVHINSQGEKYLELSQGNYEPLPLGHTAKVTELIEDKSYKENCFEENFDIYLDNPEAVCECWQLIMVDKYPGVTFIQNELDLVKESDLAQLKGKSRRVVVELVFTDAEFLTAPDVYEAIQERLNSGTLDYIELDLEEE